MCHPCTRAMSFKVVLSPFQYRRSCFCRGIPSRQLLLAVEQPASYERRHFGSEVALELRPAWPLHSSWNLHGTSANFRAQCIPVGWLGRQGMCRPHAPKRKAGRAN